MTYFMALLILIGAGLVLLAKYISHRKAFPRAAHEDMVRSTEQLKRELERSGGEIVKRMGGHVERLESLIAESDRRSDSLDAQLTELHTLSQTIDKEIDELRAAEQDARREQQLASQLLGELRAAAAGAAAVRAVPVAPVAPVERVDAQDFTSALERSMARDDFRQSGTAPQYVPTPAAIHAAADVAQSMQGRSQAQNLSERQGALAAQVPAPKMPQLVESIPEEEAPVMHPEKGASEEGEESGGARSAARVRALLLAGWTVEDIARETGMGKGAIELMQEMIRRQIAKDGKEE